MNAARVHRVGSFLFSSGNSSRKIRELFPFNNFTTCSTPNLGLQSASIWTWSDIISMSKISKSFSSAICVKSSFARFAISSVKTFRLYLGQNTIWYWQLYTRWEEMLKILYWYWCFAIDVGYQTEEIEKQITDIFKMKGIIMPISLIREAKADSTYRIRNKTLNETFGLDDDRYFHEPKERVTRAEYLKGMEEKRMELTKEITRLFYKGYSSTETAKMLNVSMATVARRKNDAKKLGWIPFRGKFFQSALSWKLEA